MERTAKGLRTCLFVLQYVAVFAAGVPVAGLRESFALSDGIREAAPSPDLPLSDGICAVAPSPDLPETACWDLTNIVERHLQHHQCAAATSTSSRPDRIRPSIEHYHCSGHGSAMERTAKGLRTCLFVLQVSYLSKLPCRSFRSDEPFIVVLPCPQAVLLPFCSLLLLLCGDVESNPGPDNLAELVKTMKDLNERTKRMESAQTTILDTVSVLKEQQQSVSESINEIKDRLAKVENQTSVFEHWQHEMKELRTTVERLEKDTSNMHSRLDDAEDRSRRNNLVFYGIPDAADETSSESEKKIINLLTNTIQIDVTSSDICRAHRIGRYDSAKARPLITKFETFKKRELVFSKRGLLKSTDIAMSEDFCQTTRNIRKKLIEYGKSKTTSFKLRYKTLTFDGKSYGYDEAKNCIFEIHRKKPTHEHERSRTLRSGRRLPPS
nr:uncharacterized protein LOC119169479 [Rhipicephalus microplus]